MPEKKRMLEKEYSSNKKWKNNLSDNNNLPERTNEQSSEQTTIFDLPLDVVNLIFTSLSISENIALSCVSKAFSQLIDNYFYHLNQQLASAFNSHKPPNITKNQKTYFFYIKKGIERDCEEIIKTATLLTEFDHTMDSSFDLKYKVQFLKEWGYEGKYKSSYIAEYILDNYEIAEETLVYIAYLFCLGSNPEDIKLFFEYESNKCLLNPIIMILLEELVSMEAPEEHLLLKSFNLIKYIVELSRNWNNSGDNILDEFEKNIIYFWQYTYELDENSNQCEVCLKIIALMFVNSHHLEKTLREFWDDPIYHYETDQRKIINRNRAKTEEFLKDIRVEFDSKLTANM